MKYIQTENSIVINEADSFDLTQTLECGQCFNYVKINENEYNLSAYGKTLHIKQEGSKIEFFTTADDFENIWLKYFDLNRDYSAIKDKLTANDQIMFDAISRYPGIRILNQEPWECLISFIISQNNRIPMIKQVIKNIVEKFSDEPDKTGMFPSPQRLAQASEDELLMCKAGFRAKYILEASKKIAEGSVDLNSLKNMPTEEARKELMTIKGVGIKIADCVLLFSLGKQDVFPTDVWIKRVMQYFYFEGNEVPIKDIHKLAADKYGAYAGFAQEYLFAYARELRIGTEQHSAKKHKSKKNGDN